MVFDVTTIRGKPFRLAIIGSRGIPSNYGGFETFAEQLGARLAESGWSVTVYGRRHHVPAGMKEHAGCRLVSVPTVRSKHLDTIVATFFQVLHALGGRYDAALVVNAANAPLLVPLRVLGVRTILNVDGIERMRAKWGRLGRLWYRIGEWCAAHLPDVVVADAEVIAGYYRERFGSDPAVIPYGGDLPWPHSQESLERLGLTKNGYLLYVSRFEPENNPHRVVEEYGLWRGSLSQAPPPLVMIGDAPYQKDWINSWKRNAPGGVIFPGAIYGEGYRQLLANCYAYVQATEVGGTHPALVEAMGYGRRIFYNASPENREVAGGCGIPFDVQERGALAAALAEGLDEAPHWPVYRQAAGDRVRERYSWSAVAEAYRRILQGG